MTRRPPISFLSFIFLPVSSLTPSIHTPSSASLLPSHLFFNLPFPLLSLSPFPFHHFTRYFHASRLSRGEKKKDKKSRVKLDAGRDRERDPLSPSERWGQERKDRGAITGLDRHEHESERYRAKCDASEDKGRAKEEGRRTREREGGTALLAMNLEPMRRQQSLLDVQLWTREAAVTRVRAG